MNADMDQTATIPVVGPDGLPPPAIPAASVAPDPSYQPSTVQPGTVQPGTVQPGTVRPPAVPDGHPVTLTCPECGATGSVDPTRRDATDFCPHCDFPLFWAKDRIPIGDPADAGDDALRRLPGAVGRVVIASVPCPHCNELNLPSAAYCVRCGLSMQPAPPPPPPPPALIPRPAPAPPAKPEVEPERLWIWWVLLITVFLLAAAGLVLAQHWY